MWSAKLKSNALLMSSLLALSGCALSPKPGHVVVAPQVKEPEPPVLVLEVKPQPTGYYQNLILDALQAP